MNVWDASMVANLLTLAVYVYLTHKSRDRLDR